MTTPVSKIVNVTIGTSPTFPARKGFGILNIIGVSARLPFGERIRHYADMDGVAADFSSSDEEYIAANVYFSQSPRPNELVISRRLNADTPGEIIGAAVPSSLASLQAITAGSFKMTIDGVVKSITGVDFSGATTMPGIAAILQTKLAAAATGATCIYDGSRLIVRSGTTGPTSSVAYMVDNTTGTALTTLLGLDAASGGKITAGQSAEAIADTLDALQVLDQSWYGFVFTKEVTEQNVKDAAAWALSRVKVFGYVSSAANVLDGTSAADIASYLKNASERRTIGQWDDNDPYAIVSALARAFTVDFNGQNTTLTLKFKKEPGITPIALNESQRLALVAKNMNYYTYFGDSAMLAEGVMADGTFFDEVHGLDWLQNAIETNVFGTLYTSTTKIPQTDKGVAILVHEVEKALKEGVNNGLLAPGFWNGPDLGEVKTGDYLPKGFYVYAQKVADQNQSDREARKAPPIQFIACGAGAIHSANITGTFQR